MALNFPATITAGDSINIVDSVAGYSAGDGWSIVYALATASNAYQTTSTPDGTSHATAVSAAVTSGWAAGQYRWQAFAVKGAERYSVGAGWVEIKPDITAGPVDARSHVERVLDAIEATLEGKATQDQQSMTINGRSLVRFAPGELLAWRDKYRHELRGLKKAERLAQGRATGNKILVRF